MGHTWFKLVSQGNQKESKEDKIKYIPSSSANLSFYVVKFFKDSC